MKLSASIDMSRAIADAFKNTDIEALSKTIVANIRSILNPLSKQVATDVDAVISMVLIDLG